MKRWPLVASFILFIALCMSIAYWGMQLFKPPLRAVAAPPKTAQAPASLDAAASLFGGRATIAIASNFQLKGVVVSGNPADSVAILVADGKPAQAVRARMEVMPGVTVKEVHREYVLLSEGGVEKRVELPQDTQGQMRSDVSTNAPVRTAPSAPPTASVQPARPPVIPGFNGSPSRPSAPPAPPAVPPSESTSGENPATPADPPMPPQQR